MTVILIAHERVTKVEPCDATTYDKWDVKLDKRIAPMIKEWVDEIMFARYEVQVKTEDRGFGKKVGKGVNGERVLLTQEFPYCCGKSRLPGLPAKLPFSWNAYAKYLKGETNGTEL